ncbi:class I SAM-dependent methyltransferase [Streptomyces albus]|uniref:class I SAM-dependent methyltransferase n=1 Tax=Streptomyces sp. NRRL F-5917 TaxID=1463873 RepID=UPI001F46EDE1|nr:class I SAM-dependent methyltransferase [Streptomyces sp. NRRL F-5917]
MARSRHHELGYRTTGIDCSPSAVALAAAHDTRPGHGEGPAWQRLDITTADLTALAHPAYALITCRLVYRWIDDKPAFLDRIRRILARPAESSGRHRDLRPPHDHQPGPPEARGLPLDTELVTTGWFCVRAADLDVLRCDALRP